MTIRVLLLFIAISSFTACQNKKSKADQAKHANARTPVNELALSPLDSRNQQNEHLKISSGAMAKYAAGSMNNYGLVLGLENGNILFVPIGEKLVNELSPITIVAFEPGVSIGQNIRAYLYTGVDQSETLPMKIATSISVGDSLCSGTLIAVSSMTPPDTSIFEFTNMRVYDIGAFASKND